MKQSGRRIAAVVLTLVLAAAGMAGCRISRTRAMTDKERMDVVERCYSKMKRYRNLVSYYTNKNISVSYLRAKKKNDLDRIMGLYGNMNERYW